MNSVVDPDKKLHMSLDDIIRIWKVEPTVKKCVRRKHQRNRNNNSNKNYSRNCVPLHIGDGCIYVTENSPLLREQARREFVKGITNKVLNIDLLRRKNEIIPAKYELLKTNSGVERILVPVPKMFSRRKKGKRNQNFNSSNTRRNTQSELPPLLPLPQLLPNNYFSEIGSFFCNRNDVKMEVDEPDDDDDEVVVLEEKIIQKKPEKNPIVVDVESNKTLNFFDKPNKTLHERFSMLGSV